MPTEYIPLVSGFVGALIGGGAAICTVWIQSNHWLRQQRWLHREKHYLDLLLSLGQLKASLEDRGEYFIGPGAEYNEEVTKSDRFQKLMQSGDEAMSSVRRQIGPASVFLSMGAIEALEELLRESWHVGFDSVSTADYIEAALDLVNSAHSIVLAEAKCHLSNT